MFVRTESGWIRAIGPAVSEKVESDNPPRRELRCELAVDAVIVGKAVHQDDRRIPAEYVANEDAAVRRVDSALVGVHIRFRHGLCPFIARSAPGDGVTDALSVERLTVSEPSHR